MTGLLYVFITFLTVFTGISDNQNYPVPKKTDKLLFYIQRNHNANTIIYDAIFDKNGILVSDDPVDVYWKRYEEQNQRMELRFIDRWYAYGVDCKKVNGSKGLFKIKLTADKSRFFWLKQTAPFNAMVTTEINGKQCKLDHLYIYADESAIWPKVEYVELFGININSGEQVYEKLIIN